MDKIYLVDWDFEGIENVFYTSKAQAREHIFQVYLAKSGMWKLTAEDIRTDFVFLLNNDYLDAFARIRCLTRADSNS